MAAVQDMEISTANSAERTSRTSCEKPANALDYSSQDGRGLNCASDCVGAVLETEHKASKHTRGCGLMQLFSKFRIRKKPATKKVTFTVQSLESSDDMTKGQDSAINVVKECPPVVPEIQDESNLFVAKFSYEARTLEDLSFSKGEILVINNTDGDWWYAKSQKSDQEGYVPTEYVAEYGSIDAEE